MINEIKFGYTLENVMSKWTKRQVMPYGDKQSVAMLDGERLIMAIYPLRATTVRLIMIIADTIQRYNPMTIFKHGLVKQTLASLILALVLALQAQAAPHPYGLGLTQAEARKRFGEPTDTKQLPGGPAYFYEDRHLTLMFISETHKCRTITTDDPQAVIEGVRVGDAIKKVAELWPDYRIYQGFELPAMWIFRGTRVIYASYKDSKGSVEYLSITDDSVK